jgi:RNA polymerase sigma-70 factor (ECF subfamily)
MDYQPLPGDGAPNSDRDYLQEIARRRLAHRRDRPVEPADAAQQAMYKAHRHSRQFLGKTEAEWRAWLRRILERVLADAFRRRKRRAGHADPDRAGALPDDVPGRPHSTPCQKAQREEQRQRLHAALGRLSEDERLALELRFFRVPPCSFREIARLLNRPSAKAVSGLVYRGQERLRELLSEQGEGEPWSTS